MAGNETTIAGDKLKKLVKKSRAIPIPFGFNPGTSDEDDEFLIAHQRKPPEMLGKIALTEGAGTKSAFGTFMAVGSEVHLTCFRTIPQLAKKFKKYLKASKIQLNVVVLDPDGNVIDSDVETLEEWFEEADDDGDDDDAPAPAAAAPGAAPGQAPPAPPPQRPDAQAALMALLTDRLKVLQPRVLAAPPQVAAKLAQLFKTAVMQVRGGKLKEGAAAISALEQTFQRLDRPAGGAPPPPAPPRGPDPRLPKLRDALSKLADRAVALLGPGAEVLLDDIARLGAQLDLGEVEAVMVGLKQAQDRIAEAAAARTKWERVAAQAEPHVQAFLKRNPPEAAAVKSRWSFATGLAAVGDWPRAVAALPGIIESVKAALPPAEGEAAQGTVAFQKARVLWVGARSKMLAEAEKLAATIAAASADDEDAADIAQAARDIVAEVQAIDERLQDVLDELTNAAEAQARARLKKEAAAVIAEYRATLSSGVFPAIDQNPFTPVAVAASARMALDQIARTLA